MSFLLLIQFYFCMISKECKEKIHSPWINGYYAAISEELALGPRQSSRDSTIVNDNLMHRYYEIGIPKERALS